LSDITGFFSSFCALDKASAASMMTVSALQVTSLRAISAFLQLIEQEQRLSLVSTSRSYWWYTLRGTDWINVAQGDQALTHHEHSRYPIW
jgi:hypothetical protein